MTRIRINKYTTHHKQTHPRTTGPLHHPIRNNKKKKSIELTLDMYTTVKELVDTKNTYKSIQSWLMSAYLFNHQPITHPTHSPNNK